MNRYYRITDGVKTEITTEYLIKNRVPHVLLALGWKIESMTFINPKGKKITISVFETPDFYDPVRKSELLV